MVSNGTWLEEDFSVVIDGTLNDVMARVQNSSEQVDQSML